jgi:mannose/fructose-specific phosphotransferase system component IIA
MPFRRFFAMIKGIIIGHGEFARALLNTVEKILGKQELIDVFSNENLSCESLAENLKNSIG